MVQGLLSKWHLFPPPGEGSHCLEDYKELNSAYHQGRQPQGVNPLHSLLVGRSPRKTWLTQAAGGTMLYSHGKQIELLWRESISPRGQQGSAHSPCREMVCTHPSVLQAKNSILTPPGTDIAVGLARCHVAHPQTEQGSTQQVQDRGEYSQTKTTAQHRLWGLFTSL